MASEKAQFAQPPFSQQDIAALNRLTREWTQKSKDMKGKRTEEGMNAEWEAASIAAHLNEIADLAKSGQAHRAYAKVRTSAPAVQKIMPASLLRAAEEAKKFFRPGVKDTMAVEDRFYFGKGRKERFAEKNDGWALQSVNVPDWGTHHFPSEAAARKYAVEKGYNFELRLLYNGKTVAIKRWDNTWSNR